MNNRHGVELHALVDILTRTVQFEFAIPNSALSMTDSWEGVNQQMANHRLKQPAQPAASPPPDGAGSGPARGCAWSRRSLRGTSGVDLNRALNSE